MEARIPARLSPAEGRKFGLTVGIGFLLLASLLRFWRHKDTAAAIVGGLGVLLLVATIAAPSRLGPLRRAWMGLGLAMSRVTSPVLMSIVFFLVISPIGLLMRLFGRRPLVQRERDGSFWVDRARRRGDLERQF